MLGLISTWNFPWRDPVGLVCRQVGKVTLPQCRGLMHTVFHTVARLDKADVGRLLGSGIKVFCEVTRLDRQSNGWLALDHISPSRKLSLCIPM